MDSSESDGESWINHHYHPEKFQEEIRNRFSLIAVVLHDPEEHQDLEATLRHDFHRLDEETGHNFLFITFADIKYDAQHLSACQRVMQKYVNSTVYRSSKNMTQTTCLLFSTLLGIPIEYFPCVVLLPVSGLFQIGQSQTPKRGGG